MQCTDALSVTRCQGGIADTVGIQKGGDWWSLSSAAFFLMPEFGPHAQGVWGYRCSFVRTVCGAVETARDVARCKDLSSGGRGRQATVVTILMCRSRRIPTGEIKRI